MRITKIINVQHSVIVSSFHLPFLLGNKLRPQIRNPEFITAGA